MHPGAGDDLIGPKDIERGLHLLTNANMTVLEAAAEEPEEQAQGAEPDLERAERTGGAREARQQAELLSDDQINQACTPCALLSAVTCFRCDA